MEATMRVLVIIAKVTFALINAMLVILIAILSVGSTKSGGRRKASTNRSANYATVRGYRQTKGFWGNASEHPMGTRSHERYRHGR